MPADRHPGAYLILRPPKRTFDLLIALLNPRSETVQPYYFGDIRLRQRHICALLDVGRRSVSDEIPGGEFGQALRISRRHYCPY